MRGAVQLAAIALMTVVAGCGPAGTPSAAAPTRTPAMVSSSPGPPKAATAICKMPIGWLENDAQNRKAAMLSVPDGALVEVADGALVYDSSRYLWRTDKVPYLYGDIAGGIQRGGGAGTTYDAAYARWLPVGSKSV